MDETSLFENVADWLGFDNRWRGWGRDAATFPDYLSVMNGCDQVGTTCRIYDWRVRGGAALHNVTGDGSTQNATVGAGPCPALLHGDVARRGRSPPQI